MGEKVEVLFENVTMKDDDDNVFDMIIDNDYNQRKPVIKIINSIFPGPPGSELGTNDAKFKLSVSTRL